MCLAGRPSLVQKLGRKMTETDLQCRNSTMPTILTSDLSRSLSGTSPFHSMSSTGVPSSSGCAARLWRDDQVQESVMAALHHPFVRALAHGSLARVAFQSYIAEDAFFLKSFAEGYAAAIQRCAPGQQHLVCHLNELLHGVQEELMLHDSYAAEWGVDLSKHQQPNPATRAYVDFLHNIAVDPKEGVAGIVTAMVPCLRLYAFLACQLAKGFPFADHEYIEWVRSYSSHEYLRLPSKAEAVLDETADSEPIEKLLQHYRRAMELEVQFFSAQPYRAPPRPISLLVLDFDDTCTAFDSSGLVMQTAVEATVAQADGGEVQAALRAELQGHLQWLVANYTSRRQSLLEEILPEPEEEPADFDMGWLGDFVDRLSEFDKEMNSVVVESGILGGIKKGMLARTGAAITMQGGCLQLLKQATDAGIPTYVVSVNWSAEMVRAALAQQGLPVVLAEEATSAATVPAGSVVVYANELEYFGDTSTGNIKRRCECAGDKGRLLDDLLLDLAAVGEGPDAGISVYIGDSMTDVPPLISADAGILVGGNDLVRQVAAVAGIDIKPLVSAPLDLRGQESHADEAPVLYEAGSWAEISAFLFNPQFVQLSRRATSIRERTPPPGVAEGKIPCVLAIGGGDSGGGAGIQADIKTCMAAGVYAATAVSALTAQNTQGVVAVHLVPPDFVRAQMAAVLDDMSVDVVKTGMLPTPEIVEAVVDELQARGLVQLVVDPVLVSTSGDALATAGVVEAVKARLLPMANIVTPNIPEASKLLDGRSITDLAAMKAAAEELHHYGPQWVLIKGGHLVQGEAEAEVAEELGLAAPPMRTVTDVLFDGKNTIELTEPYISTGNTHGTGCSLASAIAAELAKGADVVTAVRRAKKYVWRMLERSRDLPLGKGSQRPMNHGYALADWSADLAVAGVAMQGTGGQLPSCSHAAEAAREQVQAAAARQTRIPNTCDLRLYAVTDPGCNAAHGRTNAEAVQLALDGGATVVQLREKAREGRPFLEEAAAVLEVCRSRGVPLLINDRVDVALAVGADGVHVGQGDLPAAVVRRMIGPDRFLGVSVKTPEEAVKAEFDGADYLGAGAVYPTGTKDSEVIGMQRLVEICRAVSIPVVSIGGITASNAGETVAAGCAGAAVVSGIFSADSPAAASCELLAAVDAALAQRQQHQRYHEQ